MKGLDNNALWNITNYRWMTALVIKFFSLINYNPIYDCTVDVILFVVSSTALTTTITQTIFCKLEQKDIVQLFVINTSVLIAIINVAVCNLLSFPECVASCSLGILLLAGAIYTSKLKHNVFRFCFACFLLILSTACFQQFLFYYIIFELSIVLTSIKAKNKSDLRNDTAPFLRIILITFISGILYFISSLLIVSLTEVSGSDRATLTIKGIIENIVHYFTHQYSYLRWYSSFSSEIMLVCSIIAIIFFGIAIIIAIKRKQKLKALEVLAIALVSYCCMYIPGIISTSRGERTMMCAFAIYYVIAIAIIVIDVLNPKALFAFGLLLLFVLLANIVRSTQLEINGKISNNNDKDYAYSILSAIQNYESKSEKTISKVAFCDDEHRDFNISDSSYMGSALYTTWSKEVFLDYFSGKHYEVVDIPDDAYNMYFEGKDWKSINLYEQFVAVGDTAYICVY